MSSASWEGSAGEIDGICQIRKSLSEALMLPAPPPPPQPDHQSHPNNHQLHAFLVVLGIFKLPVQRLPEQVARAADQQRPERGANQVEQNEAPRRNVAHAKGDGSGNA